MKRLKKAILIPMRTLAYRFNRLRLYYWADGLLYELRSVNVMPTFYYTHLFKLCMKMAKTTRFRRLADKVIHTIPYQIRHKVA